MSDKSSNIVLMSEHEVESQQTWCGHFIYLQSGLRRKFVETHEPFYCTICGQCQVFKAESETDRQNNEIERLTTELESAKQEIDVLSEQTEPENSKAKRKWFSRKENHR